MSSVVVLGSMNMDLFTDLEKLPKIGETILGSNLMFSIGGKGANQAVACAKIGAEPLFLGKVGVDGFGQDILNTMQANGVDIRRIEQVEEVTTGIANVFHIKKDNCIVVNSGANACVDVDYVKRQIDVLQQTEFLLAQLETPVESTLYAFQTVKEMGGSTILNPAPFCKEAVSLLEYTDILTPNEVEFSDLSKAVGIDVSDFSMALHAWKEKYPCMHIIITLGGDGLMWLSAQGVQKLEAMSVEVVDTTGAGDTFNGILLALLSKKMELGQAIRSASIGASLSVTKKGAQTGMPTWQEIQAFLK